MNLEDYVRRATRHEHASRREAAREATRAELDALIEESVGEGLTRAEAERRAISLHHASAHRPSDPWSFRALVRAPVSLHTWKGALYLALLAPLGIASFVWAVGGLGLVIGLSFIVVGVFLAAPFLLSFVHLGRLHGALASWATGQPMPMLGSVPRASGGPWQRVRARLEDPQIMFGFLACVAAFVFGTASGFLAGLGAMAVFMLARPFFPHFPAIPGGGQVYPDWLLANDAALFAAGLAALWAWAWSVQVVAWIAARTLRGVLTRT